jgi:hypothetical protein
MEARLIFWPAMAMAGVTFAVALRMFSVRIAQIKRDQIRLRSIATSRDAAEKLTDSAPADNFRNLFELPVLFYLALCIAFMTAQVNALTLVLAWAFVAARLVHSAIHCSYNRVIHRFYAYIAGYFVLIALWAVLAFGLLR